MGNLVDLSGHQYGLWYVQKYVGRSHWLCRCACGTEREVNGRNLQRGGTSSCGCAPKHIDLVGRRFEKLVALRHLGRGHWLCQCDCGKQHKAHTRRLRQGQATSCGCDTKRKQHEARFVHGQSDSPTWRSWHGAYQRCCVPEHISYKHYGGRGIVMHPAWCGKQGFVEFLADMGERPLGTTLGRKDNDGPYSPLNCRWETHAEQNINRRNTFRITYQGQTKALSKWVEILNVPYHTLWSRLVNHSWSIDDAFKTPVGQHRPKG